MQPHLDHLPLARDDYDAMDRLLHQAHGRGAVQQAVVAAPPRVAPPPAPAHLSGEELVKLRWLLTRMGGDGPERADTEPADLLLEVMDMFGLIR